MYQAQALVFLHILSAMIFFGLPFTFGRWFRAVAQAGSTTLLLESLVKIRVFTKYHLPLLGLVLLVTGTILATKQNLWQTQRWVHVAPLLTLISLANLFWGLLRPLDRACEQLEKGHLIDTAAFSKKISLFSALHHTLVSILTLLMVFRPF